MGVKEAFPAWHGSRLDLIQALNSFIRQTQGVIPKVFKASKTPHKVLKASRKSLSLVHRAMLKSFRGWVASANTRYTWVFALLDPHVRRTHCCTYTDMQRRRLKNDMPMYLPTYTMPLIDRLYVGSVPAFCEFLHTRVPYKYLCTNAFIHTPLLRKTLVVAISAWVICHRPACL